MARTVHNMLNQIIVGNVFTVDDQINARLETDAKMYSHHHCLPNSKPGNIIDIFVINAKNSTVFGLSQYSLCLIVFSAFIHSVLNFILVPPKIVYGLHILRPCSLDIFCNSHTYQHPSCSLQNFLYMFLQYLY